MILEPLKPGSDSETVVKYLNDLHTCMEQHFKKADVARTSIFSRIKFDGTFNFAAMLSIVLALIGVTYKISQWTSQVDSKLTEIQIQTESNSRAITHLVQGKQESHDN